MGDDSNTGPAIGRRPLREQARKEVAEIERSTRWYGWIYKILKLFLHKRIRHIVPTKIRELVVYYINVLYQYHEHDVQVHIAPEDQNRYLPNEDEHIELSHAWVVEIVSPSTLEEFIEKVERQKLDSNSLLLGVRENTRERMVDARSGQGYTQWSIGTVVAENVTTYYPDSVRRRIPIEFVSIHLTAVHLGTGLTAIIGDFQVSAEHKKKIDVLWHQAHKPEIIHNNNGFIRAEDGEWTFYRKNQEKRKALHDEARRWFSEYCPGFFSSKSRPQLVLDLMLTDKFDPLTPRVTKTGIESSLRAVGLTEYTSRITTSKSLPGLTFEETSHILCRVFDRTPTWSLWGQHNHAKDEFHGEVHLYGGTLANAISHRAGKTIFAFLVQKATLEMVAVLESEYAELRDTARRRHGKFRSKDLRSVRTSLLSLNLDLTSLRQDIDEIYHSTERYDLKIDLTLDLSPNLKAGDERLDRTPFEPIDITHFDRKLQKDAIARLIQIDKDFRETLMTASSLGASIDTFKVSRLALAVSALSLVVATLTILAAEYKTETVFSHVRDWLFGLF
ncbi:hypothetical protein [Actinokineospora spheciospongiae]|uniref:hypothetical protein n=1 Tax=Actinokineospora spheciospongiae TaxID=909613 RepID=UPI0012681445|nr:hypothetical protein [Actinokineospora spheciospongiae]